MFTPTRVSLPGAPLPSRMSGAGVTDDGRFLVLYISEGCLPANRLYVVDMKVGLGSFDH
jgi:hypothetical protein